MPAGTALAPSPGALRAAAASVSAAGHNGRFMAASDGEKWLELRKHYGWPPVVDHRTVVAGSVLGQPALARGSGPFSGAPRRAAAPAAPPGGGAALRWGLMTRQCNWAHVPPREKPATVA